MKSCVPKSQNVQPKPPKIFRNDPPKTPKNFLWEHDYSSRVANFLKNTKAHGVMVDTTTSLFLSLDLLNEFD